jgi:hypothetical protein
MRDRGADMLTLEGAVRYLNQQQQKRKYNTQVGIDVNGAPLYASDQEKVDNIRPWLEDEANALAAAASMARPCPEAVPPNPDNGEKFLSEYRKAQVPNVVARCHPNTVCCR